MGADLLHQNLVIGASARAGVSVALAREDPEVAPRMDVAFNGRRLARGRAGRGVDGPRHPLPPPYPKVDRNDAVARAHLPAAAAGVGWPRIPVSGTGLHSPVDLVSRSAGKAHGWIASIEVNGMEVAPNLRGYNVVGRGSALRRRRRA